MKKITIESGIHKVTFSKNWLASVSNPAWIKGNKKLYRIEKFTGDDNYGLYWYNKNSNEWVFLTDFKI